MAEIITQTCTDSIIDIFSNPETKDYLNSFLRSGTPVTDQKFTLFGFCILLSTYLSSISRDVTRSIRRDYYRGRPCEEKKKQLLLVILGDFVLWIGLIFPLAWNIFHWFITLPETETYFAIMRWWILGGITLGIFYMLLLHIFQSYSQILWSFSGVISRHRRRIKLFRLRFHRNLKSFFIRSKYP